MPTPPQMKANLFDLDEEQVSNIRYWAPAFITAGLAWLLLLVVGETPLSRASGLALAVMGVTASMRRMGFIASVAGGLTMALCPIFWSQAGGGVTMPATIVLAVGIAAVATLMASIIIKRSYLGIGLGIAIFVLIFWSQIGTAQSLRLTGLVTAWFMYLLVDMVMLTNPRPGTKPPSPPKPFHIYGLLFLFAIGTINDPLVALFAPAILLSLFLSYAKLPAWYWLSVLAATCIGLGLLVRSYLLPAPPLLGLLNWREAASWIELGQLLTEQFSILGIVAAVLGLARLSRWFPPVGTVTMIAFAAYTFFGLVYLGDNREVLLLPLVMIQILWMTYAVNTFGQWVNKTIGNTTARWTHLVSAVYLVVPVILLLNIIQS